MINNLDLGKKIIKDLTYSNDGEEELKNKTAVIKPLNDELKEQQTVSIEDLYIFYKTI